jgi:hypothetical protein
MIQQRSRVIDGPWVFFFARYKVAQTDYVGKNSGLKKYYLILRNPFLIRPPIQLSTKFPLFCLFFSIFLIYLLSFFHSQKMVKFFSVGGRHSLEFSKKY